MIIKDKILVLCCVALVSGVGFISGVPLALAEGNNASKHDYITQLRAAADEGNADAQTELGNDYLIGAYVVKDDGEATKWFQHAAEQGNTTAQTNLGTLYMEGRGVNKDEAEAIKLWNKAAEQGDHNAQDQLGFAYMLGNGVPRDIVLAYMWFSLSATRGDTHAPKDRDAVAKFMTAGQINEAQTLSEDWMQKHPITH